MSERVTPQRLLAEGLLPRLIQLLSFDDLEMRVSVLWTMRNTLCKSDHRTRQAVMSHLGWPQLVASVSISLLLDDYCDICPQAMQRCQS